MLLPIEASRSCLKHFRSVFAVGDAFVILHSFGYEETADVVGDVHDVADIVAFANRNVSMLKLKIIY